MLKKIASIVILGSSLMSPMALADCGFASQHQIKSFTASFQAWKAVTEEMKKCGNFRAELDNEFRYKQPEAFAANPSLYHIAGVSTSTIVPLVNAKTIRPLDDLVEKYGQQLSPNQLIKIDGQTMAIAMMINTQHLVYRKDILEQLDIAPPTTYEEMIAAAEKIQDAGLMRYPLTGTFKTGWDLAMEFINMYIGYGGQFLNEANAPTVNSEAGRKTLQTMKQLTKYMDPEFLISDSTHVQKNLQHDKAAMANLWSSRASALNDPAESQVAGKIGLAAAPASVQGGKPAATLWWDGITIATNISDQEAEEAFRIAIAGMTPEMANNNNVATWLIPGFEPSANSLGAIANAKAGTPPYPASTPMGMMVSALGNSVSDYLVGSKSLDATLQDIENKYLVSAKESGLL